MRRKMASALFLQTGNVSVGNKSIPLAFISKLLNKSWGSPASPRSWLGQRHREETGTRRKELSQQAPRSCLVCGDRPSAPVSPVPRQQVPEESLGLPARSRGRRLSNGDHCFSGCLPASAPRGARGESVPGCGPRWDESLQPSGMTTLN